MNGVICIDHSGKEPHRQVGVGRVVTPGSLGGVMVGMLAQNVRDVGSIPVLGMIFPIFITPTTHSLQFSKGSLTEKLDCRHDDPRSHSETLS